MSTEPRPATGSLGAVDLGQITSDPAFDVQVKSRETADEIKARLAEAAAAAEHQRKEEAAEAEYKRQEAAREAEHRRGEGTRQSAHTRRKEVFGGALVVVFFVAGGYLMVKPGRTNEDVEVARTIISAALAALAGYGAAASNASGSKPKDGGA